MAYDIKLDKNLFEKRASFNNYDIFISVHKYGDNGEPKLQMIRKVYTEATDGGKFMKLGRLKASEVDAILPIIAEARKIMEDEKQKQG